MGTLTLPPSGSVYVDANVVIYAVEKIEPYATLLLPLWAATQAGRLSIVTSELTWLVKRSPSRCATATPHWKLYSGPS